METLYRNYEILSEFYQKYYVDLREAVTIYFSGGLGEGGGWRFRTRFVYTVMFTWSTCTLTYSIDFFLTISDHHGFFFLCFFL